MRAIVQRASRASLRIDGGPPAELGRCLVVLLGIGHGDTSADTRWILDRVSRVRIFDDAEGVPNVDPATAGAGLLLVSQFTLFGTLRKGARPSWNDAAPPHLARPLWEEATRLAASLFPGPVVTGTFAARMDVELVNSGPVTLILDSREPG